MNLNFLLSFLLNFKGIAIALLGLGFLVFIHELGHFLFCKFFNIPAPYFAIGIGPKIFKKKYKGTEFSLGIIPIAGYVQMGEEIDEDQSILYKYSYYKGFFVLLGGIIYNILFTVLACILISFLQQYNTSLIGNFYNNPIVKSISDESLLHVISEGDRIVMCNNKKVETPYDVLNCLQEDSANTLSLIHNEELVEISVDSKKIFEKKCFKIVSYRNENNSFFEKIKFGLLGAKNLAKHTIVGLLSIFSKKNLKRVSGFLGILKSASTASENGFISFLGFLALLSINLAFFNLLPLPVLDGGQLLLLSISKLFKKELSQLFTTILMYGSFGLLFILILFSTYNDILKIFFNN
jgi:regulator of sigma E protease